MSWDEISLRVLDMVKKTKIPPPEMKFMSQMEILLPPPDQMEGGEI